MTKTFYVTGCEGCPFQDAEWGDCAASDDVEIDTLARAHEKSLPIECPLHGGGVDVRIAAWDSAQITRDSGEPLVAYVEAPASVVRDALLLVGVDIPLEHVETRSLVAQKAALLWAGHEHLNASDNDDVERLPCPEWVAAWRR